MKDQANNHKRLHEFQPDDWALLKLQLFRQQSVAQWKILKTITMIFWTI